MQQGPSQYRLLIYLPDIDILCNKSYVIMIMFDILEEPAVPRQQEYSDGTYISGLHMQSLEN